MSADSSSASMAPISMHPPGGGPMRPPMLKVEPSQEKLIAAQGLQDLVTQSLMVPPPPRDSPSDISSSPASMQKTPSSCSVSDAAAALLLSAKACDESAVDSLMQLSAAAVTMRSEGAAAAMGSQQDASPSLRQGRTKRTAGQAELQQPSSLTPRRRALPKPTSQKVQAQHSPFSPTAHLGIKFLSTASEEQLQLLAVAYKLCPQPSEAQLEAVSKRVSLSTVKVAQWFACRQVSLLPLKIAR